MTSPTIAAYPNLSKYEMTGVSPWWSGRSSSDSRYLNRKTTVANERAKLLAFCAQASVLDTE